MCIYIHSDCFRATNYMIIGWVGSLPESKHERLQQCMSHALLISGSLVLISIVNVCFKLALFCFPILNKDSLDFSDFAMFWNLQNLKI